MGKHNPKKHQPKPSVLPKEVLQLWQANGLATGQLILGATGDMDNAGNYCSAWLSFDPQGLYIAFGDEMIRTKKKTSRKKPELLYRMDSLQTVPVAEIESLKVERYVTTGRLIMVSRGDDISLTRFSIGLCGKMQQLCDCFNAMKDARDMTPFLQGEQMRGKCPKCGKEYPDGHKVCPGCGKSASTVKRLFGFFGGYVPQALLITLLIVASKGVAVLLPKLTTQRLFDDVLSGANPASLERRLASLGALTLLVLGVYAANILLELLAQWVSASVMPRVIYDIKQKIFRAMQRLSVGFYASKQTGQLMERVTRDTERIYWFFVHGLPYTLLCLVQLVGTVVMMFTISWQLTLTVLAVLPIIFPIGLLNSKLWQRLHHREWASSARLTSMISDNINGQRVIKAFSQESHELERFRNVSGALRAAEVNLARAESSLFPLLNGVVTVLGTGVLVLGGLQVLQGRLRVGSLLSFTIYLTMLQQPLEFLSWVIDWWARCKDAACRVFEIVDAEPDILESETPVQLAAFQGKVELRELEFEYEPARPVIQKVSLTAEPGQMLGIVGKTGAGKTTIANLLSRLYDAKAGAVLLDGVDVKDLPLALLRRHIGLVSQDIYLFRGTVAENICYAKPGAGVPELIAAAKAAAAHEFIMRLPDAYETRVGDGGQDLSGGERQRLSIARTILQNPKILILDEATAAMDTATERSIQQSLAQLKQGRTTIAIAHRLSTLRDADILAVIDKGKLTEIGSFSELLQKKGAFFNLYQVQQQALATLDSI
jgi:ATP-binding cassette subfamily B protein